MNVIRLSPVLQILASSLLFFISAYLGWTISQAQGAATVIWPAAGVAALAVLLWNNPGLAGIFTGSLLWFSVLQFLDSENSWLTNLSFLGILLVSSATCLQALAIRWLILSSIGFPLEFPRLSTALGLLAISAVTALITPTIMLAYGLMLGEGDIAFTQWYWWWAGCMIGVVLILPLGFYLVDESPQWLPAFRTIASPMIIIWGFTFILYGIVLQVQSKSNGALFTEQAESAASVLQTTLNSYADAAYAVQGFIEMNPEYSVEEFQRFGKPLIDNISGLLGFTVSHDVASDQVDVFVSEQAQRWPDRPLSNVEQGGWLISDFTTARSLGVDLAENESQFANLRTTIETALFTNQLAITTKKSESDRIQFYLPVSVKDSVSAGRMVSAVVRLTPVLTGIFEQFDAGINRQTILLHTDQLNNNYVVYSTEGEDLQPMDVLERVSQGWKGIFSRNEIRVGEERWGLYQFSERPIVYDQFLLSSVIAGGFMFSGILCWFVLVLAGNANNISLQVDRQTLALRISADLLEASQEIARLGSWEWFPDSGQHHWSKTMFRLMGMSADQPVSPEQFITKVNPKEKKETQELISAWQRGERLGVFHSCELTVGAGITRHLSLHSDWVFNEDGSKRFLSIVAQDITDRMDSDKQLTLAAATFESQDAILITDSNGQVQRINQAYGELHGYDLDDLMAVDNSFGFLDKDDSRIEEIQSALVESKAWSGELICRHKSGWLFPARVSISAVENQHHEVIYYVVNIADISEQHRAQERIRQLAFYDPLTGLPNRELFHEQSQQILSAMAESNVYGALLFLDLDNFKVLNDTLGHKVGDELITEVAKRFKTLLSDADLLARFGGDEFLLLLGRQTLFEEDIRGTASAIADKLLFAMDAPFWVKGHSYKITVSIGITLIQPGDTNLGNLIVEADLAMYFAKTDGRNRFRYYLAEMGRKVQDNFMIETGMRRALTEKGFEVFYQPQYNSVREVVAMESLIRWNSESDNNVGPSRFIPLAEESSLIVEIETYVMRTICRTMQVWKRQGLNLVPIAINVSPVHFIQSGFLNQLDDLMMQFDVSPEFICIELTERVLAEDTGATRQRILALRSRGIEVSIDDFGTGFSSLSYLKQLPLSEIKIAQEFIQDLPHDPKDVALVRTISSLAKSLGMRVIAEGVETQDQFDFLVSEGCQRFQGYYFARPVPMTHATAYLPEFSKNTDKEYSSASA